MKNKKFLVTGASGFLGSHVAELLIKKKYSVVLFDKTKPKIFKKKRKYSWEFTKF